MSIKTVLITGCSSGFGLETAKYFLARGWRVVATMRSPNVALFPASERLELLPLDVTDESSVRRAVEDAGRIDALVNNAGIGLIGALEGTSLTTAQEVFATNVLGPIALMQAVIPQFRERREGIIVNVSSVVALTPFPLLSVYSASKAALNALTQSAALELGAFNVRVALVAPGRAPDTDFGKNAQPRMQGVIPEPYAEYAKSIFAGMRESAQPVTQANDVVAAVWRAVTDPSSPILLPAGADAVALVNRLWKTPDLGDQGRAPIAEKVA